MTDLQLKNYLLGNLDAPADEEIGVLILADDSLEEKLMIAENELIEDFLDKNLSPEEEKLFLRNFLICDDRQKQVSEINLFRQFSKKNIQTEDSAGQQNESSETFFERVKNLYRLNIRLAVPVLAALILAAGGLYFFYATENLSPLESDFAALNQQDFTDSSQFSRFSNVSLIAGTFRDSDTGNKLKAENLSDKIFFRLALPFNNSETGLLKAEVLKDQKTVFRQPDIRVYKNQNGQEIRLFLPKEILSKGQYRIRVVNAKNESSAMTYNFAVE